MSNMQSTKYVNDMRHLVMDYHPAVLFRVVLAYLQQHGKNNSNHLSYSRI